MLWTIEGREYRKPTRIEAHYFVKIYRLLPVDAKLAIAHELTQIVKRQKADCFSTRYLFNRIRCHSRTLYKIILESAINKVGRAAEFFDIYSWDRLLAMRDRHWTILSGPSANNPVSSLYLLRCSIDKKGRTIAFSDGKKRKYRNLDGCEISEQELNMYTACVDYRAYLHTKGWSGRRQPALLRAAGKCERCRNFAPLQVHHKHYNTLFCERATDIEALCATCHSIADIERATAAYERKIEQLQRENIYGVGD